MASYNNIIIFTNGAIGDFLMAMLFLCSVKKVLPALKLMIITPRNASMLRKFLLAYPYIEVFEINRHNFLKSIVFLGKIFFKKNLVLGQVAFGRISLRVKFLTCLLVVRPGSKRLSFLKSVFDYNKSVYENLVCLFNTQHFNIPLAVPRYNFIPNEKVGRQHGLNRFNYIVIHPCAFNPARSLTDKRWKKIFEFVSNNFPNIKIVITGSKQDSVFIQKILGKDCAKISIINLTGKLSMTELTSIIDDSIMYIGVDSGISHLAGILQKRSLIIGNLSNPCWLPTYNKNVVILTNNKNCTCDGAKGGDCFYRIDGEKYYKCMIDISQEIIYRQIANMLVSAKNAPL